VEVESRFRPGFKIINGDTWTRQYLHEVDLLYMGTDAQYAEWYTIKRRGTETPTAFVDVTAWTLKSKSIVGRDQFADGDFIEHVTRTTGNNAYTLEVNE
jgi:hypothetical protein